MKYFGNTQKNKHAQTQTNPQSPPFRLLNKQKQKEKRQSCSYDTEQLSAEVCCFET